MAEDIVGEQRMLREARNYLQAGLDLLDRAEASAEIGAYVDMAIHRLDSVIADDETEIPSAQLVRSG